MSGPWTSQGRAKLLAEKSIKRLVFVAVAYLPNAKPRKGYLERTLWTYQMPTAYVVQRKATKKEWKAQLDLFREIFKKDPLVDERHSCIIRLVAEPKP